MTEKFLPADWWIERLLDRSRDRMDEDGRPIGEVSSIHFSHVETELAPCRYPDRRREMGLPMNLSALRQASKVWGDVRRILSEATDDGGAETVADVFIGMRRVVDAAAVKSLSAPVDRPLSAARKVSIGFERVFADLWVHSGVGDASLDALFGTASGFFEFLDEAGWLVGQTQVCAGSRAMIEAAYAATLEGVASRGAGERSSDDAHLTAFWLVYALTRRTSEFIRGGAIEELPGFGDREDRVPFATWPISALIATRNQHPAQLLAKTVPPDEASLEVVARTVAARAPRSGRVISSCAKASSFDELDAVVCDLVSATRRCEEDTDRGAAWESISTALRTWTRR